MNQPEIDRRLNDLEQQSYSTDCHMRALFAFQIFLFLLTIAFLFCTLLFLQSDEKAEFEFIGLVLAVFEIFLVFALAGGFWMIRNAAQRAAAEAAREEIRKTAGNMIKDEVSKEARKMRSLMQNALPIGPNGGDSDDLQTMLQSLDNGDDEQDGN